MPVPVCPSCDASSSTTFYTQSDVPAHSCLLLASRDEAERFPRGEIRLALCGRCGCIWNTAFDERLTAYSPAYEDTQAFSPHYRAFAGALAAQLVERFGLHGRRVLEVGSGKGDFLALLCALGGNEGVGIDPAADPGAAPDAGPGRVTFLDEPYSAGHRGIPADLIVCRHTLEHLARPGDLLRMIRAGAHGGAETPVYLEVPDVSRVLAEGAFWDVYYEHCCYFAPGPFARLAHGAGLDAIDVHRGYADQYLLLTARLGDGDPPGPDRASSDLDELRCAAESFAALQAKRALDWHARLATLRGDGRTVALWGSGSKAVAFLTTLDAGQEVECVVDINPRKHGMYMAGVRQRIVPPQALVDRPPDVVIAMNPAYVDEIRGELHALGLAPQLLAL